MWLISWMYFFTERKIGWWRLLASQLKCCGQDGWLWCVALNCWLPPTGARGFPVLAGAAPARQWVLCFPISSLLYRSPWNQWGSAVHKINGKVRSSHWTANVKETSKSQKTRVWLYSSVHLITEGLTGSWSSPFCSRRQLICKSAWEVWATL